MREEAAAASSWLWPCEVAVAGDTRAAKKIAKQQSTIALNMGNIISRLIEPMPVSLFCCTQKILGKRFPMNWETTPVPVLSY
jgi:hypothetical protein